jgi:AcrR family transcriptional regulator
MPTASSSSPTSPRRAAGPRKGERREQAILDATERLLATTPFADLTIDDIARGAGISRSALYFYFASKEQVLTALHRRTYDEMVGTMQPLDDAGVPVADAMLQAIERVCAIWRARRDALRTFHEVAAASPAFGDEWRERLGRHVAALTEIIESERAAGRAAPGPEAAAIASCWFWMLENQFYLLFRRPHARREESELVATVHEMWQRMIGATADLSQA